MSRRRSVGWTSGEIDVYSPFIGFGVGLKVQLAANLLNSRLNFLDMMGAVVPFAHDNMQMCLSCGLGMSDSLLQYILGFFNKLAMEIDGVGGDTAFGVVFTKDIFRRLLIVGLHLLAMVLAFFG